MKLAKGIGLGFAIMVAVVGTVESLVANAQSAPLAGPWLLSVTVKGNAKDQSRVPAGDVIVCLQAATELICRGQQGTMYNGTVDGTAVMLTGAWTGSDGQVGGLSFCYWWFCAWGSGVKTYHVSMRFTGTVTDDTLLSGQWTGDLAIGAGQYRLTGTWKAIRMAEGAAPDPGTLNAPGWSAPAPVPDIAAHVVRTSIDLTVFTVQIEKSGQELLLKSSAPCRIKQDDRVLLHRDDQSGSIRMSTPSVVCYLRESEAK